MKALTLTQPWATLVAQGAKRFETRSWSTPYRGPLLIHAAKNWSRDDRELCFDEPFVDCLSPELRRHEPALLPMGAIVASAMLVCVFATNGPIFRRVFAQEAAEHEREFGNYAPGRFAWRLDQVQALSDPIPCRGALGLWTPPNDVIAEVREQLRSAAPA